MYDLYVYMICICDLYFMYVHMICMHVCVCIYI
jgi:hypothetical protein